MKKRLLILSLVLIAGWILTGCEKKEREPIVDYLGYSYYVWVNNSSYSITLSAEEYYGTKYRYMFKNIKLQPGEKHEEIRTAMAAIIPPGGWRMNVLFDDGLYGTEFYEEYYTDENGYGRSRPMPEDYDVRYNPVVEESYDSEEVKNPNGCRQCAGVRWTYTFTDDDYEAAVAYAERTAE